MTEPAFKGVDSMTVMLCGKLCNLEGIANELMTPKMRGDRFLLHLFANCLNQSYSDQVLLGRIVSFQ